MKKIIVVCSLFILFVGCSSVEMLKSAGYGQRADYYESGIKAETDDFNNTKTESLTLAMHSSKLMMERSIRFSKISQATESVYLLKAHLYIGKWFFLEKIIFNIDGKMFEYVSAKNSREVQARGYVEEISNFNIDRQLLDAINNGKEIRIRFYGENNYMDASFTASDKTLFAQFYSSL